MTVRAQTMGHRPAGRWLLRPGYVRYVLAALAAASALTVAFVGGALTGESNSTGGVNGLVEGLSGDSSSFLSSIGFLAPLGFAFVAGMVSTVNPCGFAMLPAYLGLYLGSNEVGRDQTHALQRIARAVKVGGVVTVGFILLFGVTGIVIGAGAQGFVDLLPWIGLSVGVLLVLAGAWIMAGGKLYTDVAGRAAAHMGNPGQVSTRGYFMFGVSYGTASLSCTLPIFLAVVGTSLAVADIPSAVGQFVLYAMGMGFVIMLLTLGMALFKTAMVGALRKTLPYIQPVSSVLMLVAGSYIIFYWLTLGRGLL